MLHNITSKLSLQDMLFSKPYVDSTGNGLLKKQKTAYNAHTACTVYITLTAFLDGPSPIELAKAKTISPATLR